MAYIYVLGALALPFILQFFLRGKSLSYWSTRFWHTHFSIDCHGIGFIAPFFYLSLRDVRLLYHASPKHDRFYLEAKRLRLWLNPYALLSGRIQLHHIRLDEPQLHYFNRQDSHKKSRFLPRPGRVCIKNMNIKQGLIFVQDETMWPVYRICLSDIQAVKMSFDVSASSYLFFQVQQGYAQIGNGHLSIKSQKRGRQYVGHLRLWGVRWEEIGGLDNLPLSFVKRNYLNLHIHFSAALQGIRDYTPAFTLKGIANNSNQKPEIPNDLSNEEWHTKREGIKFAFQMQAQDYYTTLDLGLQKLIANILQSSKTTWSSFAFVWGSRGIFNLMKK